MLKNYIHRHTGQLKGISTIKKENGANGTIINKFVKDGVVLSFSYIDSGKGKKAAKFQLIIKDLEQVEESLIFIKKIAKRDLVNSSKNNEKIEREIIIPNCISACIVAYAKCFTEAKSRGSKLEAKSYIYNALPEYRKVHDFLMHLRHQFYAHAGNANIEDACSLIIYYDGGSLPVAHATYGFSLSDDFINLFLTLTQRLKENVSNNVIKWLDSEFDRVQISKKDCCKKETEFTSKLLTWENWKYK